MPSLVAIRISQPFLALSISRYSYTFISYQGGRAKLGALALASISALTDERPCQGDWKGLPTVRRVLDACRRVLCRHGASALLATARNCTQQWSAQPVDLHGNGVCHWHASGMRLACDRIASRCKRYSSVTEGGAHAG